MGLYNGKPTISFSAWADYSHCPYLYQKERILGLASKFSTDDLHKGGAVHFNLYRYATDYATEHVYPRFSQLDIYANEWAETKGLEETGFGLLPESFEDFARDAVYQAAHDSIDITRRTLEFFDLSQYDILVIDGKPAVEYEFYVPFDPSDERCYFGAFHGLVDVIVREKATGEVFIVDYKTTKTLKSQEAEDTRIQLGLYQYAMQRLGIHIDGTITIQVCSKTLAKPQLLKKGEMSRKYILTTWEMYETCLLANGLNPADYIEEMQPKLAQARFFDSTKVYRNQVELENLWYKVLLPVVFEISDLVAKGDEFRRHLNSFLCPRCRLKEICLGELRGQDMSWTIENYFNSRIEAVEEEEVIVG